MKKNRLFILMVALICVLLSFMACSSYADEEKPGDNDTVLTGPDLNNITVTAIDTPSSFYTGNGILTKLMLNDEEILHSRYVIRNGWLVFSAKSWRDLGADVGLHILIFNFENYENVTLELTVTGTKIRIVPGDELMTKDNYDIWQVSDESVLSLSYDDEQNAMKLDKLSANDGILYINLDYVRLSSDYDAKFFRFAYKSKKISFYVTNTLDTLTGECDVFSDSTDDWSNALIDIEDVLSLREDARYFVIKITGEADSTALFKDWTVAELTSKEEILYQNQFSYKNRNKLEILNPLYINTEWDFEKNALKITSKNSVESAGQQISQSRGIAMDSSFIYEALENGVNALKFTVMYDNTFAGYINRNLSVYAKKNSGQLGDSANASFGNMVFANYGKSLTVEENLQGLAEFTVMIDIQAFIKDSERVLEDVNYLAFVISNATDGSIYFKDLDLIEIEATSEALENLYGFNEHNKWRWSIKNSLYIKTEWDAEKGAMKVSTPNGTGKIGQLASESRGIFIDNHFLYSAQSLGFSEIKFAVMYDKDYANNVERGSGVAVYSKNNYAAGTFKTYKTYGTSLSWPEDDDSIEFMEFIVTINIDELLASDSAVFGEKGDSTHYLGIIISNVPDGVIYFKNFEFVMDTNS